MQTLKQTATLLLGTMIFLLVPLVLFIFITSRSPILFGTRSFVVLTGSMKPALPVGSMVFTTKQDVYDIGNIITFKRGDITVTHRVHGIKNGEYITKGDANNAPDAQIVTPSNVIGRDAVVVPYIGRFTGFIKTPLGFFLILGIPTLLFIFFEALQMKKEWEKVIEKRILSRMSQNAVVRPLEI